MKYIISLFVLIFSLQSFAQEAVIAVGEAEQEKDKLVIDSPETHSLSNTQKVLANELLDTLRNNFIFYRHKFNTVLYNKTANSYSKENLEKWKKDGIQYFVASSIISNGQGIEARFKLWNVRDGKVIHTDNAVINTSDLRSKAHDISDKFYRAMTGKASIFKSKIVFISDRTTRSRDIEKELYIMDFDGRRVEKLTTFNSIVLSPSISPDNTKILFSVIEDKAALSSRNKKKIIKNINLKMYDLLTKKLSTISSKPGLNSGATYSRDPNIIYLTLTQSGNADIYEMNLTTTRMRKVTSHYAEDVDPSVTADGSMMTFLSNRPGRAHIYTMDPSQTEKDVKRISFVGKFNATPRFSPDGKEIVFASWVDNGFDIYKIGADGQNLVRLTKDFGSNEDPVFSPDGEFIVFTSKRVINSRKAVQDLYIMNREGEVLGQLTQNFGKNFSPQFTNILN
ncbi:MAG: DPP IV N-terminal domain-containing protein [Bacteriovoracaceae bacterium]